MNERDTAESDVLGAESAAVIAELEKAHAKVVALCNGEERWVMRIPARPDMDPDLVIGAALRHAQTEIYHLGHKLTEARRRIDLDAMGFERGKVSGTAVGWHECCDLWEQWEGDLPDWARTRYPRPAQGRARNDK